MGLETLRRRRGHNFYPPQSIAKKIPALYAQDGKGQDAIVFLHYFVGSADWFLTELDPETGEGFGWAEIMPGCGELGYVSLPELEGVLAKGLWPVERDLHWEPKPLREVLAERR